MRTLLLCLALLAPACDWLDGDDAPGGDGGAGVCDESGGGDWSADAAALECEVWRIVNERRAAGADCRSEGTFAPAAPLVMDAALRRAARLHAQDMGERNFFAHDSPGGPNGDNLQQRVQNAGFTGWRAIGENIAGGPPTAVAVMSGWMASDRHCANIMRPQYTRLGVGYARVARSRYGTYWVQDFGAR